MTKKTPYQIVLKKHVTEKSIALGELQDSESSATLKRCKSPKYVFIVDKESNKREIKEAVEEIYADRNIRVTDVNTINMKRKRRRVRGRVGYRAAFKKAVVTMEPGDRIEDV